MSDDMPTILPDTYDAALLEETGQIPYPYDLRPSPGDTPDEKNRRARRARQFADAYIDVVNETTVAGAGFRIGTVIEKGGIFADLIMPGAYYELDHPVSAKLIGKINRAGAITLDSDTFSNSEGPLHESKPRYVQYIMEKFADIYALKLPPSRGSYIREVQYGYLMALVPKALNDALFTLHRSLPELTVLSRISQKGERVNITRDGIDRGSVVVRTDSLSFARGQPAYATSMTGVLRGQGDDIFTMYLTSPPFLKKSVFLELATDYELLHIVDTDAAAQKKNPMRVFKTLLKLIDAVR